MTFDVEVLLKGTSEVVVETDAGAVPLTVVSSSGDRVTFEALMGASRSTMPP